MTAMSETRAEPIVVLTDVHQSFCDVEVLEGVSMCVAKGGVAGGNGPSGYGRVADFDVHTLRTDHERIALRKEVSMVFQQYNLFPHKTALQNVMMAPIHVLRENEREVRERAIALLRTSALPGTTERSLGSGSAT